MQDDSLGAAPQRRDYKKRTPREEAYRAIDSERDYQNARYPGQRTLEDHVALLARYGARLDDIKLAGHPKTKTFDLLRKIAAIAVRAMEEHGFTMRGPA